MRNLKIRFIKINGKYTMEFKRFGLWIKAMVPIGGSHMEKIIYGIVLAPTPSKCLNKYLYSRNSFIKFLIHLLILFFLFLN